MEGRVSSSKAIFYDADLVKEAADGDCGLLVICDFWDTAMNWYVSGSIGSPTPLRFHGFPGTGMDNLTSDLTPWHRFIIRLDSLLKGNTLEALLKSKKIRWHGAQWVLSLQFWSWHPSLPYITCILGTQTYINMCHTLHTVHVLSTDMLAC